MDWISHSVEEGSLYVSIQFMDKTDFSLRFSLSLVTILSGFEINNIEKQPTIRSAINLPPCWTSLDSGSEP